MCAEGGWGDLIGGGCVHIRESTIGKGKCERGARCKQQTDAERVCDIEANVWSAGERGEERGNRES